MGCDTDGFHGTNDTSLVGTVRMRGQDNRESCELQALT